MSDEQPPPSLRLRPRNRGAADAPVKPTTPTVVPIDQGADTLAKPAVVSVPDASPGRFRLKPKITPGSDDAGSLSDAPASAPLQSAAQDTASVSRLKLKVVTATTSDPGVESMPDANIAPPAIDGSTDVAVIADDTQIGQHSAPDEQLAPVLIPGETSPEDSAESPVEALVSSSVAPASPPPPVPPLPSVAPPPLVVKPVKAKVATRSSRFLILGCLGLLLVGGGAGAYFYLMQEEPPPPPPLVRRAPVTPAPKPAPAAPAVAPPVPPVPTPESAGLDPLPPAPGAQKADAAVASKPAKAPPVPVMTPAFRLWLEGVRINGVTATAGAVPRVIINGRLVRPGDTIDSTEGIVFESVDTEKKCVMFKNRAGFVAAKPY